MGGVIGSRLEVGLVLSGFLVFDELGFLVLCPFDIVGFIVILVDEEPSGVLTPTFERFGETLIIVEVGFLFLSSLVVNLLGPDLTSFLVTEPDDLRGLQYVASPVLSFIQFLKIIEMLRCFLKLIHNLNCDLILFFNGLKELISIFNIFANAF